MGKINYSVDEQINSDIKGVKEKISKLSSAIEELQSNTLDSKEKLEKILKVELSDENSDLSESDFKLQSEELSEMSDNISKLIQELENVLDNLPSTIESRVKSKLKHVSSEMISKKYAGTISNIKTQVDEMKIKYIELQEQLQYVLSSIDIREGTIFVAKERMKQVEYAKKEEERIAEEMRKAKLLREQEEEQMRQYQLEQEELRKNTEMFLKVLQDNPDTEIGKVVYRETRRKYIWYDKYDKPFDVYGDAIFGSKLMIPLRNEFGLPTRGDYEKDTSDYQSHGNGYMDDDAYVEFFGYKATCKLVFVPEDESTVDEMEQIEIKKAKIQLLKDAKEIDPKRYDRLGKIHLPKLDVDIVVSEGCLIDKNLDPEDLGWKALDEKNVKKSEEKIAKQIIRKAKRSKVLTSVVSAIGDIFKKREPIMEDNKEQKISNNDKNER